MIVLSGDSLCLKTAVITQQKIPTRKANRAEHARLPQLTPKPRRVLAGFETTNELRADFRRFPFSGNSF